MYYIEIEWKVCTNNFRYNDKIIVENYIYFYPAYYYQLTNFTNISYIETFCKKKVISDNHLYGKFMNIANDMWRKVANGCNLNRETLDLMRQVNFNIEEYERFWKGAFSKWSRSKINSV